MLGEILRYVLLFVEVVSAVLLIIVILIRQSPVARRAWRHQGRIVRKHRDNFPNRRH